MIDYKPLICDCRHTLGDHGERTTVCLFAGCGCDEFIWNGDPLKSSPGASAHLLEALWWVVCGLFGLAALFGAFYHWKPTHETKAEQISRLVPLKSLDRVHEIEQELKAQDETERR